MEVGEDVKIAPQAVFRYPELVTIGDRCAIDEFTVVTTQLRLGSFIHIASHCSIIGGCQSCFEMEDFSGLAAGCRIICASDDFRGPSLINPMVPEKYRKVTYSTVRLGRFATLGTNVVVLPGVTIGEGTTVAAGTLVRRDLKPWSIYAGVPASHVGFRPKDEILELAERFLYERRTGTELETVAFDRTV